MYKHFRLLPFGVGLAIGFIILKYYKTPTQTVLEYPHPDNVKDRIYRDKNGICYSYTANKVDCDKNEGTLRGYPLQG